VSELAFGCAAIEVPTPYGTIRFPHLPELTLRGACVVDSDGVRIHVFTECAEEYFKCHSVYQVRRLGDDELEMLKLRESISEVG